MTKTAKNITACLVSLVLAQAAGGIGALATVNAIPEWYQGLTKPLLAPPNWIFGYVWTMLYVLMAVAAFLIWQRRKEPGVVAALWVYAIHLVVNTLWSVLFFGMRSTGLGIMGMIVLWTLILTLVVQFWRIRWAAAVLLLPYLLWVSFAGYLNYMLWVLNP